MYLYMYKFVTLVICQVSMNALGDRGQPCFIIAHKASVQSRRIVCWYKLPQNDSNYLIIIILI